MIDKIQNNRVYSILVIINALAATAVIVACVTGSLLPSQEPAGTEGSIDAKGSQSPTEASCGDYLSGYEVVVGTAPVEEGNNSIIVSCPTGKKALAAGFKIPSRTEIGISQPWPPALPGQTDPYSSWYFVFLSEYGLGEFDVYVTCACVSP